MAPLGSLEETWLADHEPMICVLLLKMGILDCHVSLLEGVVERHGIVGGGGLLLPYSKFWSFTLENTCVFQCLGTV